MFTISHRKDCFPPMVTGLEIEGMRALSYGKDIFTVTFLGSDTKYIIAPSLSDGDYPVISDETIIVKQRDGNCYPSEWQLPFRAACCLRNGSPKCRDYEFVDGIPVRYGFGRMMSPYPSPRFEYDLHEEMIKLNHRSLYKFDAQFFNGVATVGNHDGVPRGMEYDQDGRALRWNMNLIPQTTCQIKFMSDDRFEVIDGLGYYDNILMNPDIYSVAIIVFQLLSECDDLPLRFSISASGGKLTTSDNISFLYPRLYSAIFEPVVRKKSARS